MYFGSRIAEPLPFVLRDGRTDHYVLNARHAEHSALNHSPESEGPAELEDAVDSSHNPTASSAGKNGIIKVRPFSVNVYYVEAGTPDELVVPAHESG